MTEFSPIFFAITNIVEIYILYVFVYMYVNFLTLYIYVCQL